MTSLQFRNVIAKIGLSQVQAARVLGVTPRTVRRWALDEVKIPPTADFPDFDGWRRCQVGLKRASGLGSASPTLNISTTVRKVRGSAVRLTWKCDNHPP